MSFMNRKIITGFYLAVCILFSQGAFAQDATAQMTYILQKNYTQAQVVSTPIDVTTYLTRAVSAVDATAAAGVTAASFSTYTRVGTLPSGLSFVNKGADSTLGKVISGTVANDAAVQSYSYVVTALLNNVTKVKVTFKFNVAAATTTTAPASCYFGTLSN